MISKITNIPAFKSCCSTKEPKQIGVFPTPSLSSFKQFTGRVISGKGRRLFVASRAFIYYSEKIVNLLKLAYHRNDTTKIQMHEYKHWFIHLVGGLAERRRK
jgi:hypothetical protein